MQNETNNHIIITSVTKSVWLDYKSYKKWCNVVNTDVAKLFHICCLLFALLLAFLGKASVIGYNNIMWLSNRTRNGLHTKYSYHNLLLHTKNTIIMIEREYDRTRTIRINCSEPRGRCSHSTYSYSRISAILCDTNFFRSKFNFYNLFSINI